MRKIVAGLLCASLLLVKAPVPSQASWVEDHVDSLVTNYAGPSQHEAQGRQYYSGGNLQARKFFQPTHHPFSLTFPSVKAGCGGIDIRGGTAMLDFSFVIDSMQRIISNAPALAFNIALKELSENFAAEVKWLKEAQNFLNNVQLDECRASKAVATLPLNLYHLADGDADAANSIKKDFMSAVYPSWEESKNTNSVDNPSAAQTQARNQRKNADCGSISAAMNSLLTDVNINGSVVEYIMNRDGYSPLDGAGNAVSTNDLIRIMRGLVGDIIVYQNGDTQEILTARVPPCESVDGDLINNMVTGRLRLRNKDFNTATLQPPTCTDFAGGSDIMTYILTKIEAIYNKMDAGNVALSPVETALLRNIPGPTYNFLRQLYVANAPRAESSGYSLYLAHGFAYSMLDSILDETGRIRSAFVKELRQCGTRETDTKTCTYCLKSEPHQELDSWKADGDEVRVKLSKSWAEKSVEMERSINMAKSMVETKRISLQKKLK